MSHLTSDQVELAGQYEGMLIDDLYNLIGNLADEYGDAGTKSTYVLGTPNVFERGSKIVLDIRVALCRRRAEAAAFFAKRQAELAPIEWVSQIVDVLLALSVTGGVPPIAIAVALGKLAGWSTEKLCATV